jgi:hypothetical protein
MMERERERERERKRKRESTCARPHGKSEQAHKFYQFFLCAFVYFKLLMA